MRDEKAFQNLAKSKKRNAAEKAVEEEQGRRDQEQILAILRAMPDKVYINRKAFRRDLQQAAKAQGIKITSSLGKAIESAFGEPDETADVCRDKKGNLEADSNLRDYEYVPLAEDVQTYFEREVLPHVPDAWINADVTDHKDGDIGKVGYEINFNRYFYKYEPPRPLDEIEADIRKLERDIMSMLSEVTR